MDNATAFKPAVVRRYMSLSRFVWLLKKKTLWLSRGDLLGDSWEMAISHRELERVADHIIDRTPLPDDPTKPPGSRRESAMEVVKTVLTIDRRHTYVNCWTNSDAESYAMWQIYCGASNGIAIQTSLERLAASIAPGMTLEPVSYAEFESATMLPNSPVDLILRKRQPFTYEQEYRIVFRDQSRPRTIIAAPDHPLGVEMKWDPETHIERLLVHPRADGASILAVEAVIECLAPRLRERVVKSGMSAEPPF